MEIAHAVLEEKFTAFCTFISAHEVHSFTSFQDSSFVNQQENYKLSLYTQARAQMGASYWRIEQAGTGKIQEAVSTAIVKEVLHNGQKYPNNLVYWDKKDTLSAKLRGRTFELLLYDFYKNKTKDDSIVFEAFQQEGLSYQLSAYLFFLKDPHQYLPISQERFDEIFNELGLTNFKTSRNISWANYSTYNTLIKQVRTFLKTKDRKATLLDAHSFLWIVGNQMKSVPGDEVRSKQKSRSASKSVRVQVDAANTPLVLPTVPEQPFMEGKVILRLHKAKERNRELVQAAKKARLQLDPSLQCQVCGFSFRDHYGALGEGFIEAHHVVPLSQLTAETETKLEDLVMVCANCHRMLHRRPLMRVDELITLLQLAPPVSMERNQEQSKLSLPFIEPSLDNG